ncbi:MAG: prepilin-type N-terminal cleavage/methylation domain-containing protein [Planctomyces sp.]|nr:prepilin-type N-terminal cleavage/methylation domain-containing protein [Planctomyces sp.]
MIRVRPTSDARARQSRDRRAYTLLEILIALALSLALLSAVYGSLNLYWTMSTAGQNQVVQAQLARSILRRMEVDAGSVMFGQPQTAPDDGQQAASSSSGSRSSGSSGGSGGGDADGTGGAGGAGGTGGAGGAGGTGGAGGSGGGSSSSSTSSSDTSTTTGEAGFNSAMNVGVIGDATTLMLHVNRPSRGLEYTPLTAGAGVTARASDLLSVSWFLAAPGAGGLQGAVGDRETSLRDSRQVVGLARLEGDRMALNFADENSNMSLMAEAAEIIAPEVGALQFRYFDGSAWYDSWDSGAAGMLPMAIEVTLGFIVPDDRPNARRQQVNDAPQIGRTIRHVIAIPMATPFLGGDL